MSLPLHDAEPLWLQAYHVLAGEIASGRLPAGRHLASERALGERLTVSRITLRRALRELAEQGLIEPSPGRGWQVAPVRLGEPSNALLSFTALARERGLRPQSRVLEHTVRLASIDEAERLRIAPGSEVLDLKRLRLLDDVPIVAHFSLLALARAPGIEHVDLVDRSLFAALEEDCGVVPARADCVAQAAGADERAADLLGLRPGDPVMLVREDVLDEARRPLMAGELVYRGDRYRMEMTLLRPGGQGTAPA